MLYGVTINGINTLTEWGLFLCSDLKIGEPTLKANLVDIPGGDGALNMSYAPQGRAVFNNREITFTLAAAMTEAERNDALTDLRNAYHGRECDVILPNDTTHYWHGIVAIGQISGYNSGKIPVTITAEPYKLKNTQTTVTSSGNETVTLTNNGRKAVVPLVSTDDEITLAWGTYSVAISAGDDQTIPQLVLENGDTDVTITGTASVSFVWREGSL